MTQPKINKFVTDCEQPASLDQGDVFAYKNDNSLANGNTCGWRSVLRCVHSGEV